MAATPTPVVFIPALLCDGALYADVIARLGDAIEPHVLLSPKPRIADSVADILARAPARFALVGTSYGGTLALEVALAAPGRVMALWIMGGTAAAPAPGGPDLSAALIATPDAVIDMLARLAVHKDATAAAATFKAMARRVGGPAAAAQATALAARGDETPRLLTLPMPALILWGQDDALIPVAAGRALAEALPHAHFHVLPDCGHLPTLEKPAESAALFAAFLRDDNWHAA
jgi:pimeloyl-ACP methyl ester carboxylesterase